MAWPVRPEFFSLYQWKDLVYVSQISSENGPHSDVINIFQSDRSEAQMFCVSFNNLTVLTGLAVLKKAPLGLDLYHGQNIFLNFDLQKFLGKQTLFSQCLQEWANGETKFEIFPQFLHVYYALKFPIVMRTSDIFMRMV
jgi:hypothetical protein